MDYAAAYSRVVRYAAAPHEVRLLLKEMATDPAHLEPGSNLRLVLADALDEAGMHAEAAHAKSTFPMSVHNGKPVLSTLRLHRLLRQMRRYYGGEHIQEGEPTSLRLEAAAELERVGRTHEAQILRSNHPIDTHTHLPLRSEDGTAKQHFAVTGDYQRHSFVGGELVYPVGNSRNQGFVCHNCANGENGSETLRPGSEDDDQWQLDHEHPFEHEEGAPIQCDHCNRDIEATYGDPETYDED